jgi:hypothetical protein
MKRGNESWRNVRTETNKRNKEARKKTHDLGLHMKLTPATIPSIFSICTMTKKFVRKLEVCNKTDNDLYVLYVFVFADGSTAPQDLTCSCR